MPLTKQKTPEEIIERSRVARNVSGKTFATASIVAFLTFVAFAAADHAIIGFLFGVGLFSSCLLYGGIAFWLYEKNQSKARLTQIAETKRLDQEKQQRAARQLMEDQERARREEERAVAEREKAVMDEQQRRDTREYILRKLSNTNTFIELYNPNSDTSGRIKQAIANELTDIIVKHPRAELKSIIEREPDVRGMVLSLVENLQAKGINSPEAMLIIAAAH